MLSRERRTRREKLPGARGKLSGKKGKLLQERERLPPERERERDYWGRTQPGE
jgi:hypothetical protein